LVTSSSLRPAEEASPAKQVAAQCHYWLNDRVEADTTSEAGIFVHQGHKTADDGSDDD
jgi:hypothetical protein